MGKDGRMKLLKGGGYSKAETIRGHHWIDEIR